MTLTPVVGSVVTARGNKYHGMAETAKGALLVSIPGQARGSTLTSPFFNLVAIAAASDHGHKVALRAVVSDHWASLWPIARDILRQRST
jgi:hypothetical protein